MIGGMHVYVYLVCDLCVVENEEVLCDIRKMTSSLHYQNETLAKNGWGRGPDTEAEVLGPKCLARAGEIRIARTIIWMFESLRRWPPVAKKTETLTEAGRELKERSPPRPAHLSLTPVDDPYVGQLSAGDIFAHQPWTC